MNVRAELLERRDHVTGPEAAGADALVHAQDLQGARAMLRGRRKLDAADRARPDGLGGAVRVRGRIRRQWLA